MKNGGQDECLRVSVLQLHSKEQTIGTGVDLRMVFYPSSICAIIYWAPTYISHIYLSYAPILQTRSSDDAEN